MYEKVSSKKKWNIEIISLSKSEAGGLKEVISLIKGKNIYSLRVKFLEPIIKKEQESIDKLEATEIKEVKYEDNTMQKPRKSFGKKSLFSKLENLDNE